MLFLWATGPLLPVAISVVEAFGFRYVNVAFTWIKLTRDGGKPSIGMGHYTRSNAEYCLLGVKGKPRVESRSVHSVVMSPRREHSRKPNEVRDRIVELCGDVPRIELFARESVAGWDRYGFEAPDGDRNIAIVG